MKISSSKYIVISIFCLLVIVGLKAYAQDYNLDKVGFLPYTLELNDVWGYVAADGTEYALVGTQKGTSIVSLANPAEPEELFYLPGAESVWRDIKTWKDYAYVTNEEAGGLLIVDLSNLPDYVDIFKWTGVIEGEDTLVNYQTAHNIWIDEHGVGYLLGTNVKNKVTVILDLDNNPTEPEILGYYEEHYVHDAFVRGDTLWTAEINNGTMSVVDVSDKANPIIWATQETPLHLAHNVWLSDDNKYAFTTDETTASEIVCYDVSDLEDIEETDRYRVEPNDGCIPHNVTVLNNYLITAYYSAGVTIVDFSQPHNLVEVGRYDTSPLVGTGYIGCWGIYPYLPSGLFLAADIEEGLFILEPTYVQAAYIEGIVTDSQSGLPIFKANVELSGEAGTKTQTSLYGEYATGLAEEGMYQLQASAYAYYPKTINGIEMKSSEVNIQDIELDPIPPIEITLSVFNQRTGEAVKDAEIALRSDSENLDFKTNENGKAKLVLYYEDAYDMYVGKWGYRLKFFPEQWLDYNTPDINVYLIPDYYDEFLLDYHWEISGDVEKGMWEKGDPKFVKFVDDVISPEDDIDTDLGTECYTTEIGSDLSTNVKGGRTILTSPAMDLSGFEEPVLSYYRWTFVQSPSSDSITFMIKNGLDTLILETAKKKDTTATQWHFSEFSLKGQIDLTDNMHFIVDASDQGNHQAIEASIDVFQVRDDTIQGLPPQASFDINTSGECSPVIAFLTNTSSNEPGAAYWEISHPDTSIYSPFLSPNIFLDKAGVYSISLKVSNDYGEDELLQTDAITVYENPMLELYVSNEEVCLGEAIKMTAIVDYSNEDNLTFSWSGTNTDTFTTASITIEPPISETYGVSVATPDGCAVEKEVWIAVNELPYFELEENDITVCANKLFTLDITNEAAGNYTYEWTGGEIIYGQEDKPNQLAGNLSEGGAFIVTAADENGCTFEQELNINLLFTQVNFALSETEICAGESINFLNQSQNGEVKEWIFTNKDNGEKIFVTEEDSPEVIFEQTGIYDVELIVEGCETVSKSLEDVFTVYSVPQIEVLEAPEVICHSTALEIITAITHPAMDNLTYTWTGDAISEETNTSIIAFPSAYNQDTVYQYVFTVIDKETGCSAEQIFSIQVNVCPGIDDRNGQDDLFRIWPNPVNDVLNLEINNTQNTTNDVVSIYNTFGQLVWQCPFQNKIDIKHFPAGMYFILYEMKENKNKGEKMVKKILVE